MGAAASSCTRSNACMQAGLPGGQQNTQGQGVEHNYGTPCLACTWPGAIKQGNEKQVVRLIQRHPSLLTASKLPCTCSWRQRAKQGRHAWASVYQVACTHICMKGNTRLLHAVCEAIAALPADAISAAVHTLHSAGSSSSQSRRSSRSSQAVSGPEHSAVSSAGAGLPPSALSDPNQLHSARKLVLKHFLQVPDASGLTGLMAACKRGDADMVDYLLGQGVDVWLKDHALCTALHHAAKASHAACIHSLLRTLPSASAVQGGVRYTEARSLAGITPLMYAALGGSASATSALLQYGANMFACTISTTWGVAGSPASQSNVLMFAVMGKNEDCVRVLLRHYADWGFPRGVPDPRRVRNEEGKSPFQLACALGLGTLSPLLNPNTDICQFHTFPAQHSQQHVHLDGRAGAAGGHGHEHGLTSNSMRGQHSEGAWTDVPKLALIAAHALQGKLHEEVTAIVELQSQLASHVSTSSACQLQAGYSEHQHKLTESCASGIAQPALNVLTGAGVHGVVLGPEDDVALEVYDQPCVGNSKHTLAVRAATAAAVTNTGQGVISTGNCCLATAKLRPKSTSLSLTQQLLQHHMVQSSHAESCDAKTLLQVGSLGVVLAPLVQALADPSLTQADNGGRVDGVCGVCWHAAACISLLPCGHVLCAACAAQLCDQMLASPLRCPFCRTATACMEHCAVLAVEQRHDG